MVTEWLARALGDFVRNHPAGSLVLFAATMLMLGAVVPQGAGLLVRVGQIEVEHETMQMQIQSINTSLEALVCELRIERGIVDPRCSMLAPGRAEPRQR
jgi:hypothetical protein